MKRGRESDKGSRERGRGREGERERGRDGKGGREKLAHLTLLALYKLDDFVG